MKKFAVLRNLCIILVCFLLLICTIELTFKSMNKNISEINRATVENIGFTYLSGLAIETVNHGQTYFSSRFEIINQTLNNALILAEDEKTQKDFIINEISAGVEYVALYTKSGEREVLRGDRSIQPLDMSAFDRAKQIGENKVILTVNKDNERMLEMVLFKDFKMGDREYSAILCGMSTETLNSVLNLFYSDEMVYSFIVRKADGAFVVRNEGARSNTYFDRINNLYEEYNGKLPGDYISEIREAMDNGEEYRSVFVIDGERRIMFARPFTYSDWYLITFMHYNEMEGIMASNNQKRVEVFNKSYAVVCTVFCIAFVCYVLFSYKQLKKLQELNKRVVMANESKSEFLSNMSHDIRTPMNIIVGVTEIARANLDNKEKIEECLNKIARSSKHLLSLINDVLDMSKIESGKMTLSMVQISLRESMENIVAIIQPQIRSKHQRFDIYIHDIITEDVYCDNLRLNQVLINLLSNAVKYTPEEGVISVALYQEESEKGSDYVKNHIIVKDNGIGMTESFIKIVFDNFTREDVGRVRKEEGTGLGLAITKHIVDIMGGTITVESEENKGSEFHVILDLKKGNTDTAHMSLDGLKALVVDDDEEVCISTVNSLKEIGTAAEYVTNGSKAIGAIKEEPNKFDVILVDWQMPSMDGVETAKNIRKYTSDNVPIILISAYDRGDFEEQAKNAGIDGFISKPLFKSTLFFGINQHINGVNKEAEVQVNKVAFNGERILLAEDNELNREIAYTILTDAGLAVDCVENGKLCTERFSQAPLGYYKAILMDIRMPVMNGYEASRIIRAMDRIDANVPIIAMTADAFAEDVAKAEECGMNGHISKPLDINALFYMIKKELGK